MGHLSERNSTKDIFLNFWSEVNKRRLGNPHSAMVAVRTECRYTGVWTENTRRHPVGFGVQGVIEIDFLLKFEGRFDRSRAVAVVAELQQIAEESRDFGMFEITSCIGMDRVTASVFSTGSRARAASSQLPGILSYANTACNSSGCGKISRKRECSPSQEEAVITKACKRQGRFQSSMERLDDEESWERARAQLFRQKLAEGKMVTVDELSACRREWSKKRAEEDGE